MTLLSSILSKDYDKDYFNDLLVILGVQHVNYYNLMSTLFINCKKIYVREMHKLFKAQDKSLHRTRHYKMKVTHKTFSFANSRNLMNTLHKEH